MLGLPNGDVATGSTGQQQDGGIAGCRVRVWRRTGDSASGDSGESSSTSSGTKNSGGWTCVAAHDDHGGPVRSLCLAPHGSGGGFASTSNDGTVAVRSWGGEVRHTAAHPSSGRGENFVYGAAALLGAAGSGSAGPQAFVSCSEDCSAAVWSVPPTTSSPSSSCEVVEHPDGVWCVCALPDSGDFATGGNDGVVRLWTRDPSRAAPAAAQAASTQAVAAAKASRQGGPSPEEVAKLPLWADRLAAPGRGEGDVKVFNKAGVAVAAQWAAASADWVEVRICIAY